jgi:hypothetical protein
MLFFELKGLLRTKTEANFEEALEIASDYFLEIYYEYLKLPNGLFVKNLDENMLRLIW